MKHLKKPTLALLIAVLLIATGQSCTDHFADMNKNRYQVNKEELGRENYSVGSTLKTLQGMVVPTQEHLNQFAEILAGGAFAGYAGTTVDGWTSKFSTYNPPSNWVKAPFVDVYEKTYPAYRDMFNQTSEPVALALTRLLRVAIMHRETDIYGPIPYSKVIQPTGDIELTVAYDTQEEVYAEMFKELEEVGTVLEDNKKMSAEAYRKFDDVYYGDISKWIKYLHSLQLRMAMRLVYVNSDLARRIAESAVSSGVITANADNALLKVEENRIAMIWNDWNDHRAAAEIINYMNGFKDPRREKMFTKVGDDYVGMRIGSDPADKKVWMNSFSKPVITDTDPILWMNAAEVTFLRAEGALRGWEMGGKANELYKQAIALSFEERGVKGASEYAEDATSEYPGEYKPPVGSGYNEQLSNITIQWQEGDTYFERNLERIILQKWIAIYPLSIEAWSEFRRTGYPRLMPVALNKSGGTIPEGTWIRRLPYPAEEYSLNGANVSAAVTMLGGADTGGTRVWWDKKEPIN